MADTYFEEIDGEFTANFGEGQTLTAVGIDSVEQTVESEEDSGINAFKVVLTDGRVAHFYVRNGSRGSIGAQGPKGDPGDPPVRGTDYWTDKDKEEIKSYVEEAILGGAW